MIPGPWFVVALDDLLPRQGNRRGARLDTARLETMAVLGLI
jgi:hypothetical protein